MEFKNLKDNQFKGQRYCKIVTDLIKKVDLLGLVSEKQMDNLCGEFSFCKRITK